VVGGLKSSRSKGIQRDSLLFEPGAAADVDLESIYQLALQGLDDLCGMDESLEEFRSVSSSGSSSSSRRRRRNGGGGGGGGDRMS